MIRTPSGGCKAERQAGHRPWPARRDWWCGWPHAGARTAHAGLAAISSSDGSTALRVNSAKLGSGPFSTSGAWRADSRPITARPRPSTKTSSTIRSYQEEGKRKLSDHGQTPARLLSTRWSAHALRPCSPRSSIERSCIAPENARVWLGMDAPRASPPMDAGESSA